MKSDTAIQIPEPKISSFLFADTRMGWVWLLVRLYAGYEWIMAGWEKVMSPAWVGPQAGSALQGFLTGSLQKVAGPHPDVSGWYAWFINNIALSHAALFSNIVSYGEVAVGVALVLGAFTGIAAFFGAFMNLNYLFAGTISINPILFVLQLFLILGWRVAGWVGVDRWLLPKLGVPWQSGTLFKQ